MRVLTLLTDPFESASPILTAGTVTWDNLTVGTSPLDVGLAVPEPATFALLGLAGGLGLMRRRVRLPVPA
jgi:hypothetical protein